MAPRYRAPGVVLTADLRQLLAEQVYGFFSGGGCPHPDPVDGDCDSATGESHENGHGT